MLHHHRFTQYVLGLSVSKGSLWLSKGIYVPFSGPSAFVYLVRFRRCSAASSRPRAPPNTCFLGVDKPLYLSIQSSSAQSR